MKMGSRVDRRDFLRGASFAALVGTGATPPFGLGGAAQASERDLQHLVRSVFSDPGRAALVGGAFLKANPQEADRTQLLDRTVGRDRESCTRLGRPAGLRTALRARIRSDLMASRTTSVGGWILSITEARLCALACLAASPTTGTAYAGAAGSLP